MHRKSIQFADPAARFSIQVSACLAPRYESRRQVCRRVGQEPAEASCPQYSFADAEPKCCKCDPRSDALVIADRAGVVGSEGCLYTTVSRNTRKTYDNSRHLERPGV